MEGERKAGRSVVLDANPSSVLDFESFAEGLDFLSPVERHRVMIAGGEILDNLIREASPMDRRKLRVRVTRRRGSVLLAFYFRSPGFAAFSAGSLEFEPLFDHLDRRWRGLGLLMCRNLARRIAFRPGELLDRIFLEFDRQL